MYLYKRVMVGTIIAISAYKNEVINLIHCSLMTFVLAFRSFLDLQTNKQYIFNIYFVNEFDYGKYKSMIFKKIFLAFFFPSTSAKIKN